MKHLLGGIVISVPFVILTWTMISDGGWRMALCVWSIVIGTVGMAVLGVLLLFAK